MPATASRGMVSGSGPARRAAVLRCLIAALVVTIIFAGLVVLIIWLVVRPKPIDYAITRGTVRHFNVTPSPGATVNATFYLTMAADNPNRRVSMRYDHVQFVVLYGESAQLAVADYVPPFRQPHHNETRLDVRAVARSVPVSERTAQELEHDRAAGSSPSTCGCARACGSRWAGSRPGTTPCRRSARRWSSASRPRRRGRSAPCRATSPSREGRRVHYSQISGEVRCLARSSAWIHGLLRIIRCLTCWYICVVL